MVGDFHRVPKCEGRDPGAGGFACYLLPSPIRETTCARDVPITSAQFSPTLCCALATPPGNSQSPKIIFTSGQRWRNCLQRAFACTPARRGKPIRAFTRSPADREYLCDLSRLIKEGWCTKKIARPKLSKQLIGVGRSLRLGAHRRRISNAVYRAL
jgi:hypothetical protein